ncbi:MAG TPA: hypothetical protein VLG50_00805 [Candidatus Saccharimonadales bacterium]|nr:hypothetical protein [Candidatus Saccharimonadales bacterium]
MLKKLTLILGLLITNTYIIQPIDPLTAVGMTTLAATGIGLHLITRVPNQDLVKSAQDIGQKIKSIQEEITNSLQTNDPKRFISEHVELKRKANTLAVQAQELHQTIESRSIWPCNYKFIPQLQASSKSIAHVRELVYSEVEKLEAKSTLDFFMPLYKEFSSQPFSNNHLDNNSIEKIARKIAEGNSCYPVRDCLEKVKYAITLLEKNQKDVPYDQEFINWMHTWHDSLQMSQALVQDNITHQSMMLLQSKVDAEKRQAEAAEKQAKAQRDLATWAAIAVITRPHNNSNR